MGDRKWKIRFMEWMVWLTGKREKNRQNMYNELRLRRRAAGFQVGYTQETIGDAVE